MTLPPLIAGMFAVAVLAASARALWRWRDPRATVRPQSWRIAFLLLAQAVSALLLYFFLFPPPASAPAGTLVVLTADAARVDGAPAQGLIVALPEASPAGARWIGAERVPDLATALRRHPATDRLIVIGTGLTARDVDAAKGRALAFHPAPPPRGLIELASPDAAAVGRKFAVAGRAHGLRNGSAELLDPAGRRLDRAPLDAEGGFRLHGSTRAAGLAIFRLRLRDARARIVENPQVPLRVTPARALRALALAGAPNPELKFLRRWALDAGIALDTRIDLGAGLQIANRPAALDRTALDRLDLLLLDERSWSALGGAQRANVLAAVERGLGLLLRLSAASGAGERQSLRALGFSAGTAPQRETRLGAGFVRAGDAADALPTLTRSPLRLAADDGVVALADAAGDPLAVWRARGRGRIGVAAFDDSYRLVLAGRGDAHGEVWSRLAATLARAEPGGAAPRIAAARPHWRSVLCGIAEGARVIAPDGTAVALRIDPRSGEDRCAGFWANAGGWHLLREPASAQAGGGRDTPFLVRDARELPALHAQGLRERTFALAGSRPAATAPDDVLPGARWPWFGGWLLLTAAIWWLERSRHGLRAVAGA